MPTPRLRVLIADDHVPTRGALRADLEEDGIEVCAEVGTGAHAIDAALSLRPDVCLIGLEMPDGGIVAAETISHALPSVRIVLMTATPDEKSALAAARAGAVGYLDKARDPRWLPQVVRAVAAGQAEYPQRFIPGLLRAIRAAGPGVQEPERPATLRSRKDPHALASGFRLGLPKHDLLSGKVPSSLVQHRKLGGKIRRAAGVWRPAFLAEALTAAFETRGHQVLAVTTTAAEGLGAVSDRSTKLIMLIDAAEQEPR